MKTIARTVFVLLVLFSASRSSDAATLTLNALTEDPAIYTSLGVSFSGVTFFTSDSRLPDDGAGITNSGGTGIVNFAAPVSDIGLTWATSSGGVSFFATAFDASHSVVSSFFFDGSGAIGSQNGTASLLGLDIASLEFHDGGSQVAIDTLSFTPAAAVPEPASMILLGSGVAGLVARRARARRARG